MLLVEFFTILAADGCEPLFARAILGHVPVIVPLTAIFCVVAPVEAHAMFPLYEPADPAAILTYMVCETVPDDGVNVIGVVPKPDPEEVEISKPLGGVTVMFDVKK